MFLLDTNVVSELRKAQSRRADRRVAAWASSAPAGSLFLSAITVMELESGVLRAERRSLPHAPTLRSWLEKLVLPAFAGRVFPVDVAVARRCAGLHVPDPQPERDALIAATALVHGMTVVTRNVADFRATGVPVLNPWSG